MFKLVCNIQEWRRRDENLALMSEGDRAPSWRLQTCVSYRSGSLAF